MIPDDWCSAPVAEIADIVAGGTPSTSVSEYWDGEIPWCTPTDVTSTRGKTLNHTERTITHAGLASSAANLLPEDSLLLCTRATVGDVRIAGRPTATNQGFKSLIVRSPNDHVFIYYQLTTLRDRLLELSSGSTFLELSKKDLARVKLLLPPPAEQQAIADALSDADALVESLDALIAKKRDMKQAAMQRFRTPDRIGVPAALKKLSDVVEVCKGELITSSTSGEGTIPVIAGGKEPAYFTNHFNREGPTITVSASGANAGYVALRSGPLWASDCSTISATEDFDITFLAAQMLVRQDEVYRMQFGGAQPHVRPNDLASLVICLPSVEDQRRLGQVIADMDAEIDSLVAHREKAELVKQGMMQQLLSGRVRLV